MNANVTNPAFFPPRIMRARKQKNKEEQKKKSLSKRRGTNVIILFPSLPLIQIVTVYIAGVAQLIVIFKKKVGLV